ncbi:hypothetical protein EVAR_42383_1 [Eumeta japonica]|uniref:Uncharacterized protein n=1 Tax=Eumeta variegata TaxID=151549 RepID=A0A4C1YJB1_EUMVA|nr:hypothetical protein EVAR_42383_1 [Eumeta japonica]
MWLQKHFPLLYYIHCSYSGSAWTRDFQNLRNDKTVRVSRVAIWQASKNYEANGEHGAIGVNKTLPIFSSRLTTTKHVPQLSVHAKPAALIEPGRRGRRIDGRCRTGTCHRPADRPTTSLQRNRQEFSL